MAAVSTPGREVSGATGGGCRRPGIYRPRCHPEELEAFAPPDRLPPCPRCEQPTTWTRARLPG